MLTGEETPDAGAIRLGDTAVLGYVDQNRTLDPNKNVWEEISGGEDIIQLGKREVNSSAPMSPPSTSRAATSRSRSASFRAASATACTSPRC